MAISLGEGRLLLDGAWIETGEWHEVRSPYTGEVVASVPWAGKDEARQAVDASERAMRDPLPAHARAAILDRIAQLLREREDDAVALLVAECGKPVKAARVEATRAVSTFTLAAAEARKLAGETVPMDATPSGEGKLAFTLRIPIGVIGAITPFNFPLNLVAHKVSPAIAAGCAVVLKPAEKTPLSALLLAEIATEAGLPAGWLNVVVGPAAEIGDVLVDDSRVRLITFTGSAEVGWGLRERAARKKVTLELGNSTPVLVEADCDIDEAATRLAASAFGFAGQSCISVQRIYVRDEVYDAFLTHFLAKVEALKVGDPEDESTDVGPVVNEDAHDRVLSWIDEATKDGAAVLTGGRSVDGVIMPTVLTDVSPEMKVSCREVFGPVCTVGRYGSLEEGFRLANATDYGLQAGIFTRNVSSALAAASALDFGGVTVNEAPTYRADQMPYGGVKASGNTKEGPAHAVREMTDERLVVLSV